MAFCSCPYFVLFICACNATVPFNICSNATILLNISSFICLTPAYVLPLISHFLLFLPPFFLSSYSSYITFFSSSTFALLLPLPLLPLLLCIHRGLQNFKTQIFVNLFVKNQRKDGKLKNKVGKKTNKK